MHSSADVSIYPAISLTCLERQACVPWCQRPKGRVPKDTLNGLGNEIRVIAIYKTNI